MTEYGSSAEPLRHPWLDALQADPALEVRRLLAGQAAIDPYSHAETADAAELLFSGLTPSDPAVQALDAGLLIWLGKQRNRRSSDVRDYQVQVLRAIRALETIARVPVRDCIALFWTEYVKWYSWADQQIPGTEADMRASFFRTLALTQERLPERPYQANIPFWLAISNRAGRVYPDHYIDLAILGLRRVPLPVLPDLNLSKEGLCVIALVNWASAREHLGDALGWRWGALRHAFPRFPDYWRTIFHENVLPRQTELSSALYEAWARSVGVEVAARRVTRRPHDNSEKREVLEFAGRISSMDGAEAIAGARRLVEDRERRAQEHGLVDALAMTACNLGQRLLRVARGPLRKRAETALDFAITTLRWRPQHTHGWSLWRDALVALGRRDEAVLVAWESINRFPEVAVLAVNLCQIWLSMDRTEHARALLEETLEKTGYVVALTMLAGLLLRTRKPDEIKRAEQLLRNGARRRNIVSMNMLAGVLIRKGPEDWDDAIEILEKAIEADNEEPRSKVLLASLLLRKGDPEDREEVERLLRKAALRDDVAVCMLAEFLLSRDREGDFQEAKRTLRAISARDLTARAMLSRLLRNSADPNDTVELEQIVILGLAEIEADNATDVAPSHEEDVFWAEPAALSDDDREAAPPGESAAGPAGTETESRQLRSLVNHVFAQVVSESIDVERGGPAAGIMPESEENGAVLEGAKESFDQESTSMLRTISPSAVAARSAFVVRHGFVEEKASALHVLKKLAEEDDLPFARFLLLGSQPGEAPRAEDIASGSFGLALYSALRAGLPEGIADVRGRFPQEGLLCSLAEAYVQKIDVQGRSLAADYLQRVRAEGAVIGPASLTFMELTQMAGCPLSFANDNDPRLIAALGKTFESIAIAVHG